MAKKSHERRIRQNRADNALRQQRLSLRARRIVLEPEPLAREVGPRKQLLSALLMGRYTDRMKTLKARPGILPPEAWAVLSALPVADAVLSDVGEKWSQAPDLWGRRTWPEILRWGLDQASNSCRLLRLGGSYGAIALTRAQLERWTMNIAHHFEIEDKRENEEDADYISRVWSIYGDERPDMGPHWAELSEWLHGRGRAVECFVERGAVGDGNSLAATEGLHASIAATADLVFRQVRGGVSLLAKDPGKSAKYKHLQSQFKVNAEAIREPPELFDQLRVLDLRQVNSGAGTALLVAAARYRNWMSNPMIVASLTREASLGTAEAALVERRGRAVARALWAYKQEEAMLGRLDQDSLEARLFRYIAMSEMALIVSTWCPGHQGDALASAAAALNSAWWLWLEDTDDALICIRGVLEQTSRARSHRMRPAKAARLEGLGWGAPPARWLEAAGWRRLASLNRALGEFSHVLPTTRWTGARAALTSMQAEDEPHKHETARGNALEACAYLLSFELLEHLEQTSPVVAQRFRDEVVIYSQDELEEKVSGYLERSLAVRDVPYGSHDFIIVPRTSERT